MKNKYVKHLISDNWLELIEDVEGKKSTEGFRDATKTLRKEYIFEVADNHNGIVISSAARAWAVLPDNSDASITCVAGGIVKSPHTNSSLIAVGDRVQFIRNSDSEGIIVAVGKRKTKLSRRDIGKVSQEQIVIANAEQLLIVMAAAEPFYNRRLIDRYLIAAEKGDLSPIICINKIELMPKEIVKDNLLVYDKLGIPILLISAMTGEGMDCLENILRDKFSVLSGPSGVGKSTITNRLIGHNAQRTDALNVKFGKGKHVTSASEIFKLKNSGIIADTPGLRDFAVWDLSPEETPFYFHDFDRYFRKCKFNSCTHLHEPDCAVRRAVESGRIDSGRYQSYVNIMESLIS